ncbi:hypothetical protein MAR_022967 [Mya arenaria]|uniref:Uncharacterized protein n=1 Tax=Mya arenaria TaxID=6604 RepID=A0ABY7DLP7_MYAAR|nr:hypothetical protein MAR_022967 [Mya arenaria]
MDMFKRIGNTALNAVLGVTPQFIKHAATRVTPQFIKNKATQFTEWLSDYVEPQTFSQTLDEVREHVKKTYKKVRPFEVKENRSALRRFTTQYEIEGRSGYIPQTFLNAVRPDVVRLISANRMTKIKVILNCRMERTSILTGDVISEPASFKIEVNLEGTDVSDLYTTMTDRIMEAISNFQRQGNIIGLEIHTVKYEPLRGNSYIPLPQKLASKKAITNMKNEVDMCFMWSVLRALNPIEKHAERID